MELTLYKERPPELMAALAGVWRRSVEATHAFLGLADIERLEPLVKAALAEIPVLIVASDSDVPAGFMGLADGKIEMLFLSPDYAGQGTGRRLVELAIRTYGVRYVDVNEQNPGARGFYEHMGFEAVERLARDDQGNPFPILKMRLRYEDGDNASPDSPTP
ncbi:GNAT family N-acetyltransferase [Paenibacillus sp. YN15]|uniref:GNAT family N-acetyltransferase n=1 Tax=Paenibacillus sp. YN15 TaxID=1742774 RepID=UPI000DCF305A|nr:GNAT family N-acetyltransferase [Paenibacillus sp. YN15]RAU98875.1 GNAT family N-acetyltransferase [Paenibacillus sp. YN15]